jgi:hypothetical protein
MENATKYLIIFLIMGLGFTEYNIFVNGVSAHDAYMSLGKLAGMFIVLYCGYTSGKKSVKEKKVEEDQPK